MSAELFVRSSRGVSVDAHIYLNGQIYNATSEAFEDFASGNYLKYAVELTEQGDSGIYTADFPTPIVTAGIYQMIYVRRQGALPVETTDIYAGAADIKWNGTSISVPNDLTGALITRDQAKDWLQIATSDEDDMVDQIVLQSSEIIKQYCNRDLVQTTYTEYYDGGGRNNLYLRNYPIISVTTLNHDTERAYDSATDIDVDADALVDKTAGIIKLWNNESAFVGGVASVKVVYSAGYADIPRDIQEAALLVTQHVYRRYYQDQKIGVASETVGDRTTSFDMSGIPAKVRTILDRYKKQGFVDHGYNF